jgi:3-deoxy-manno-octulosonate cytidylyltransferase (CMP-KDO synthetase)
MKILAIIPARMGSSRFPGKPMAKILGLPMIGHVYKNVSSCKDLTKTIVATCDEEIIEYIESIGGQAVLTSKEHERASDRCTEALHVLENQDKIKYDIIVMVQGDEPMTIPEMISQAIRPMLSDSSIDVINLLGDINDEDEFKDRNCIKVVCDLYDNAMFFSREPIPTLTNTSNIPMKKQVCIIPFKRDFLIKYSSLKSSPMEIIESIDMMRVLEHGYKVKMVPTTYITSPVDTLEDLQKVEKLMSNI